MVDRPKPYTSGELMRMAVELIPFDPLRVVATYANEDNWTRVHADQRCYWSWIGPVIVGYELADNAFRFGLRHVAPADPVTLTEEERESILDVVQDCVTEVEWIAATDWETGASDPDENVYFSDDMPDKIVETLTQHGFRLVRTGGAVDGNG